MKTQQGRGPHRAPPDPPRGRPSRARAALGLIVAVGLAVTVTVRAAPKRPAPERSAPFDPGPLTGMRPTGEPARVPRPGTVLYVDDACPYCAVELARWSEVGGGADAHPTVVISPRSDPSGRHVPAALRATMLHDADGSIARALGVRAVPFLAVLDTTGAVVAVRIGANRGSDRIPLDTHTPAPEVTPR